MASLAVARSLAAVLISCALNSYAAAAAHQAPPGTEDPTPVSLPDALVGDAGRPAPADGPAGMVIVTDATLAPAFRRLASAHERHGLTTRVRTLQAIRDAYPGGRDDGERIRMFLKDARADWGIEFALMGGDEPLIPMRRAYVDQLPPVLTPPVILLPTDQYYACLDGDWNADGDDRWGEIANPATGDAGDDADVIPELCVGRAPVTTRPQAQDFVDRTIRALEGAPSAGSLDVLLVSGNFPLSGPISLFSPIAENLRAVIDTASTSGATFTRLYGDAAEWPGALPLTRASLFPALEQGHDLSLLLGQGGPGVFELDSAFPPTRMTADELLSLHAPPQAPANQHVAMLSACVTTPGMLSVGAALVLAKQGSVASVLGPSDIEFISTSHAYLAGYLDLALRTRGVTIGEAMRANLRTTTLSTGFGIVRLSTLGNNLLGDPALPFPVGTAPPLPAPAIASPTLAAGGHGVLVGVTPNPARTRASIALDVAAAEAGQRVDVAVIDLAGRHLRTLARGPALAGTHSVEWDLCDDRGARVATGLYFVRATMGTRSNVTRVVVGP